ncbi:hypothetical protein Pan44_50190 [Caulifigura coniformis]|uniref:Cytochrome c domain-containing protein n=1 Tax=Caulifigura coniformis TaxID=2527983 RepID=A0A517SLG0_9PLAN|nr:DUF1549 and DUF1553 domain-containing protein [Caulifigura coniformis]QDT56956.1 hypothetical protein Pan44_50190 [Caulifigura coniformis]
MIGPMVLATLCLAANAPADSGPIAVSALIDRRIEDQARTREIPLSPRADDAEFFRRLTIDLRGHIPSADEVREFLADPSPDKRTRAIKESLAHPDHGRHFATTWRRLLLPEAESQAQVQYFLPGFEAWLIEAREKDRGFDEVVRELVAAPIHGTPDQPQMVLTDLSAPNPIAYIATKEADPGKIAAGVTRLFLGVRLECAQCHDHPFDKWTRKQFWNQAAFFSGISRRGRGTFAPVIEAREMRTIGVMETGDTAEAVFLTGETPEIPEGTSPRKAYATWMTSPGNPFFARAVVNRVWAQLMGTGLVDPVDDFQAMNPPSHPELLDELAMAFESSGYQFDTLYTGICSSAAYQRTSRSTDPLQDDARLFTRMAVKPMTAEQLYDSLLLVADQSADDRSARQGRGDKRKFLDLFATPEASGEPVTSMPQSLYLMNSGSIERAIGKRAKLAAEAASVEETVQELTLAILGRPASHQELTLAVRHIEEGGASERPQRIEDFCWALLNLPEFRWNH